jgi:hypothetical protein
VNVDAAPARLWSWSDAQFLAIFRPEESKQPRSESVNPAGR